MKLFRFLIPLLLALALASPSTAALPDIDPEVSYTATGSATSYTFLFKVFEEEDLTVTVDGAQKTLGSDYTVTGAGNDAGGTITFTTAPPLGAEVAITRATPLNRKTDYTTGGPLRAKTLNDDIDRVVAQIQENGGGLNRALKFPRFDTTDPTLPDLDTRKGKILGFDGTTGKPIPITNPLSVGDYQGLTAETYAELRLIDTSTLTENTQAIVAGRSVAGDGGEGVFRWVSGDQSATVSADTQSGIWVAPVSDLTGASGAWKRQNVQVIDVRAFGCTMDGIDSTTAFQGAVSTAISQGLTLGIPTTGTLKIASGVTGSGDITIVSIGPGKARIDVTGSTAGYPLDFTGSTTAIPDLASDVVANANEVTFVSDPGLSPGDVFLIFNPTNSSWSGYRTAYKAGEYCRVLSVSGNTVTLEKPLYEGYASAAVDCYKINSIKVNISELDFVGDTSTGIVRVKFGLDCVIENIKGKHSKNSILVLDKCFNTTLKNPDFVNKGASGDDYGLSISNCQHVRSYGGRFYGRRHGVAMGGDAEIGCVPYRDCKILDAEISNDPASGTHSADFHGNGEYNEFINCDIWGGASWQGKDNGYVDCRIHTGMSSGPSIYAAEILGGRHYFKGGEIKCFIDPIATGRGVVDVGGNTTSITANCKSAASFHVENATVFLRNMSATTNFMRVENSGSNQKINIKIDGVDIDADALSVALTTALNSGTADSDYIIVDNISAPAGTYLAVHSGFAYSPFPHRMMQQKGKAEISIVSGANNFIAANINYRHPYPRVPVCSVTRTGRAGAALGYISNRIGVPFIYSASGTSIRPAIATDDAADFSGNADIDLNWVAGIDEI